MEKRVFIKKIHDFLQIRCLVFFCNGKVLNILMVQHSTCVSIFENIVSSHLYTDFLHTKVYLLVQAPIFIPAKRRAIAPID